ncbi:Uncharacterised protein [uncultured archaeon]|nr:Uncharacterised protein [uncultured archaeon]
MESPIAPPCTINFAISTGSEISRMLPRDGEENFISVISEACLFFLMLSIMLFFDLGNFSDIL